MTVVGGGPGGTAAAIMCARAGLRVALLERECFPRERPGETLHPGVEPLLEQLGVLTEVLAAGFPRHDGNWITWGGAARFEAFGADGRGPWLGFQAWRADFDAILLERARSLGVRVVQPCRAVRPLREGARVCGVRTDAGDVASAYVIDAAGGRHWLARQLGLRVQTRSPALVARYGYASGECPARDAAPAVVADARGWTWTARVRPGLYQWTRLTLPEDAAVGPLRAEIAGRPPRANADGRRADDPPAEFERLTPRGPARGADVTWRVVMRPAGAGYFLVGDAAAVLDPASSHGVLKALMTGIMAAHSIGRIAGGADESRVADSYRDRVHAWFEHDVAELEKLYVVFRAPPADAREEQQPRRYADAAGAVT